jgi:excisionase family DNA binding protein
MLAEPDPYRRLLSQKEEAAYLGISYWTLRDLVFRGDLPCVRINRRLLLDRQDLDAFLERTKTHYGP